MNFNMLEPFIDPLRKLLTRKRTIGDVTIDELMREKVGMDQEERRLVEKVEQLERDKAELFARGRAETSDLQKRRLAEKIKAIDGQARHGGQSLQFITKQQRILNGFLQIKESERLLRVSGLSSLIADMDLGTLRDYVEQASSEGVFQLDKFETILGTLDEGERALTDQGEDEDIASILRAFDEGKLEQTESPPLVEPPAAEASGRERSTEPPSRDAGA